MKIPEGVAQELSTLITLAISALKWGDKARAERMLEEASDLLQQVLSKPEERA